MPSSISEYIINARRFRPKTSENEIVIGVINRLARDILLGENVKRKNHLKYLLLDLCARYRETPLGWIYYSRDSTFYTIPPNYNPLGVAYRPLIAVIDKLISFDMVESKKGFYDDETGVAFQSRIRPTPQLIEYFENIPLKELKDAYIYDESIQLRTKVEKKVTKKGKTKTKIVNKFLKYEDDEMTCGLREQVHFFNDVIAKAHIDLYQPDTDGFDALEIAPTELRINLNNRSMHRVFNDAFTLGGRFYGGWWQNVPKTLRDHILIDGEPTIELDFKGFHIALLYAFKGVDYFSSNPDADPYKVEGFDRETVKLLLQTILNAKDPNEAKSGFRQARFKSRLPVIPKEELNQLIEKFESMHALISEYFYKGEGKFLQRLDAEITDCVIHACMKRGEPESDVSGDVVMRKFLVLPLHDSFRVQAKYKEILHDVMTRSLHEVAQVSNDVDNMPFYYYKPRFNNPVALDIDSLPVDINYQRRREHFQLEGLLPELKILRKQIKQTGKDYYKLDVSYNINTPTS